MNILIVEDDKAQVSLLTRLLRREGHNVKAAMAPLPAFELIRRGSIDVVLMDLGLPGLDGLSFVRKLKKYDELAHIPIIALTGQPREFGETNALRAGCVGYMEKPIDTKALLNLLKIHGPATTQPHAKPSRKKK
ncbi:MAG: response regulator [Ignavibacteriae bacterium]|nr:response regulator [Ignavibacteria bacterium]MBI3363586.1 response regulator [Ignavibacteriota bacterium]